MNHIEYNDQKHEFEQAKATFTENELAILTHIQALHDLLEKRQPMIEELTPACAQLKRAAIELKTGDAFRFDLLVRGMTYGEVVKAWMDRYYGRKRGGHDLSYEQLLSNRADPREKPGKQYDSTGREVEIRQPRKLKVGPVNMSETIKKLSQW